MYLAGVRYDISQRLDTARSGPLNMALSHKCSCCGNDFVVNRVTLLKSGWGRSLTSGLRPASRQFDDYQKVKCPSCGLIEKNERILSYGFLRPTTVVWLVLVACLVMLLVDFLT